MKKMMLAVMTLTMGIVVSAQVYVATQEQTASSYNAYSVPEPIMIKFQTTYPASAIATTWQPMNGWWRASYKDANNSVVHVYYSMEPYYLVPVKDRVVGYKVTLPVTNTYVPDNVIQAAVNRYGTSLYSITKMRIADNSEIYQVSLLESGTTRYVWLNSNSMAFTEAYPDDVETEVKAGDK